MNTSPSFDAALLADPRQLSHLLLEHGVQLASSLFGALLTLLIGLWLARRIARGLARGLERAAVESTLAQFLARIAHVLLVIVVLLAAIGQLGVQTASIIAMLGAAAFAVGLALQGSLANFASGILLIVFRPFRVGDFVEAAGVSGTVSELQIFSTVLTTPDNRRIVVPNASVTSGAIINFSALPTRRVELEVGVGYGEDLAKVRAVLKRVLDADARVLADPEPTIAATRFDDSSINIVVRAWVESANFWPLRFDLVEAIKTAFDREGIEIPFPQRDVQIRGELRMQQA